MKDSARRVWKTAMVPLAGGERGRLRRRDGGEGFAAASDVSVGGTREPW